MTPFRLLRYMLPALILTAMAIPAGAQTGLIFRAAGKASKSGSLPLKATASALKLEVDMTAFNAQAAPQMQVNGVPLPTGGTVNLELTEFNIIPADAQITYTNQTGRHPLNHTARLYRGTVAGDPASDVYMAFSSSGVMGSITTRGKGYEIATDVKGTTTQTGSPIITAAIVSRADLQRTKDVCGVQDDYRLSGDIPMSDQERAYLMRPYTAPAAQVDYSVYGAFDGDYEYSRLFNGDSLAAADYMISTVGRVSAVYERDISCQIVIGWMNIWLTNTDPYVEFPVMLNALEEARGYWGSISRDNIKRGFVNVFSGKAWTNIIGIAYLNTLCYNQNALGFCAMTRTNTYQDGFVCAHENGHIFSSVHTHSCSWKPAIDSCTTAEDGSCYGANSIHQTQGTIMSYCASTDMKFHQKCINFIKNYIQDKVNHGGECIELSKRLTLREQVVIIPTVQVNNPVDTLIPNFYINDGKEDISVVDQQWTGRNTDHFSILSEAPPFVLKKGETKDLKIHFDAKIDTASQGVLTVYHTGLNPAQKVTVEAYAEIRKPILGLSAGPNREIDFKSWKVGEKPDTLAKKLIKNLGKATLFVNNTYITGPDRFEFRLVEGNAPFKIEAYRDTNARLRFAPLTPGPKSAYLVVETNGGKDSVHLKGDSRTGPLLQLGTNGLVIDFGSCNKKTLYDTAMVKFFYNIGSDTMQLITYVGGLNKSSFTVPGSGIVDLAPGEGLDLYATFFDSTNGLKQAYLVINTDTPHQWDTVQLRGMIGTAGVHDEQTFAGSAGITVTPNPTSGTARARIAPLPSEAGAEYTLRLTDVTGREFDHRSGKFTGDAFNYTFRGAGLAPGTYYVTITTRLHTRAATVRIVR